METDKKEVTVRQCTKNFQFFPGDDVDLHCHFPNMCVVHVDVVEYEITKDYELKRLKPNE